MIASMIASIFPRKKDPDIEITALVDLPFKIKKYYFQARKTNTIFGIICDTDKPETRIIIAFVIFVSFICAPIITRLVFGCAGFLISYQLYYIYGAVKAGDPAWGMLKTHRVHIHHWLYCLIILLSAWITGITHPFLIGLCSGGITHGVQFCDWHKICI